MCLLTARKWESGRVIEDTPAAARKELLMRGLLFHMMFILNVIMRSYDGRVAGGPSACPIPGTQLDKYELSEHLRNQSEDQKNKLQTRGR